MLENKLINPKDKRIKTSKSVSRVLSFAETNVLSFISNSRHRQPLATYPPAMVE